MLQPSYNHSKHGSIDFNPVDDNNFDPTDFEEAPFLAEKHAETTISVEEDHDGGTTYNSDAFYDDGSHLYPYKVGGSNTEQPKNKRTTEEASKEASFISKVITASVIGLLIKHLFKS